MPLVHKGLFISKKECFLLFWLLFALNSSQASSYSTVTSGSWNSAVVWQNGQIPPLAGGDSIHIRHAIMYNSTLNLVTATYLEVDSGASLCGHYKFFVRGGSVVVNYGDIYADTMGIAAGGLVNNYGFMQLANLGVIAGTLNSGSMQVGGNFLCSEKAQGLEEADPNRFAIGLFPQPVGNGTEIHCDFGNEKGDFSLELFSLTGELVREIWVTENGNFALEGIEPGIYLVRVEKKDGRCGYGKLIVAE